MIICLHQSFINKSHVDRLKLPSYEDHDYFSLSKGNKKRKHSENKRVHHNMLSTSLSSKPKTPNRYMKYESLSTSLFSPKAQRKRRKFPISKNQLYRRNKKGPKRFYKVLNKGPRNKLVKQKHKNKAPNSINSFGSKLNLDRGTTKDNITNEVFKLKLQRYTITPEIEAIRNNIKSIIAPLSQETSTKPQPQILNWENHNPISNFTRTKINSVDNTTVNTTKYQPLTIEYINNRVQATNNQDVNDFNANGTAQKFGGHSDIESEISPLPMVMGVKHERGESC